MPGISPNNQADLSRQRGNALRGMAILVVLFHNFVHLYPHIIGENEFVFKANAAADMLYVIRNYGWAMVPQLLSFFVICAISIFLFLSGYGLVKRYERDGDAPLQRGRFIVKHYLKLFKPMLPLLLVAAVLHYLTTHITPDFTWRKAVDQALFITNLYPNAHRHFILMPWWFLGMILQLYIIYALLLHAPRSATGWQRFGLPTVMIVACWAAMRWLDPVGTAMRWMHVNFVGRAAAFCIGLMVARCEADEGQPNDNRAKAMTRLILGLGGDSRHKVCDVVLLVASGVLIVLSNLWLRTWLWASVFDIVAACAFIRLCGSCSLARPFVWLGSLSAYLYVVHPFVRNALVHQLGSMWLALAVFIVASVALAWLYRWLLHRRFITTRS